MRSSRLWKVTTASRPPGLQRPLGGGEPALELVELGVQMDADRLEGARRRVALLALPMAKRAAHDRGKLGRSAHRAGGDDRAGDARGRAAPRHSRQRTRGDLGLVGMVEEVGGGLARPGSSACRAGRRPEKEKPRSAWSSCIERDADIQRDAVDRGHAALGEHAVHLARSAPGSASGGRPGRATARFDRLGIAIEGDHSSRPRLEHGRV